MAAGAYLQAAIDALQRVAATQQEAIRKAAAVFSSAVLEGRSIFAFGASHSFMVVEELFYRTGGLMLVNPIYPHGMNTLVRPMTLTSRLERLSGLGRELLLESPARERDPLLLVSTSGRNSVIIDMALAARERNMPVVGITSQAYAAGVSSRHPSGKKLPDLCDVVLDNGAPWGDAAVAMDGFPQKVGPLSSVTGIAVANALACEIVAQLLAHHVEPPVFMSANVDGGDAYNARLLKAHRDRIHYMT